MSYSKIKDIKTRLWGKYDVSIIFNEDVNIIVGINGSGKTTLLNEIYKLALENLEDKNQVIYVPSIDNIAMRDKRKTSNALTQDLEFYMFDMKTGPSMMYYRMSMIDASAEKQAEMKARIEDFRSVINGLGEKQILLIMLRVFLLEGKESYVLLDEPENSLDISWQYKLIDTLTKLNPNAQFFITTHSPSIFGAGWGDKIIYMEDVTTPVK